MVSVAEYCGLDEQVDLLIRGEFCLQLKTRERGVSLVAAIVQGLKSSTAV